MSLDKIIWYIDGILKWPSIDKDNMEFKGVLNCYQMDALRAAKEELHRLQGLEE